jgi:hypothetical protein
MTCFFLGYESDRADSLSLLRHLLKKKIIVLDVVLTRDAELEGLDALEYKSEARRRLLRKHREVRLRTC